MVLALAYGHGEKFKTIILGSNLLSQKQFDKSIFEQLLCHLVDYFYDVRDIYRMLVEVV